MDLVRRIRSKGVPDRAPAIGNGGGAPEGPVTPYALEPARPWLPIAIRAALWSAIGIGFVGGVVGLLRPAAEAAEPVAPPDDETVPATVANFAELAVETWMTATEDDQGQLATYFAELPDMQGLAMAERTVGRVRAVGGRRLQEGYWQVTVAVEVSEPGASTAATGTSGGTADPTASDEPPGASAEGRHTEDTGTDDTGTEDTGGHDTGTEGTRGDDTGPPVWHLQVGILGNARGGLVAVDAPALMPPVDAEGAEMGIAVDGLRQPAPDDPLADTVEGFLRALLAGQGDLDRYLVRENRGHVASVAPAPFVELDLELIAVEEIDASTRRVRVEVRGTTAGGTEQLLRYELLMEPRDGQWLIRDAGGAPTLAPSSGAPAAGG